MHSNLWVEEIHNQTFGTKFKVNQVLFSGQSEFQAVDIVQTVDFGRMLLNDGLVMLTERDEMIYHEMMTHLAFFVHPEIKSVLIVGGGDGGTAREVGRHKSVERMINVEIDEMVVTACREHLPQTGRGFDHPHCEVKIQDGVKYMAETKEKFDLILIDSTDPIGPAAPLFSVEFYQNVNRCLNDDGIVVAQGEGVFLYEEEQKSLNSILKTCFPKTGIYNFSNISYPTGRWSFQYGSKKYDFQEDFDEQRLLASDLDFYYYNEKIHRGCFALPEFQRKRFS